MLQRGKEEKEEEARSEEKGRSPLAGDFPPTTPKPTGGKLGRS